LKQTVVDSASRHQLVLKKKFPLSKNSAEQYCVFCLFSMVPQYPECVFAPINSLFTPNPPKKFPQNTPISNPDNSKPFYLFIVIVFHLWQISVSIQQLGIPATLCSKRNNILKLTDLWLKIDVTT